LLEDANLKVLKFIIEVIIDNAGESEPQLCDLSLFIIIAYALISLIVL